MTLHNMALVHMDKLPGAGFKKLNFLLSSGTFPPETFANLLLLYCAPQHGFLDLAADVMAENPDYCATLLSKVGAGTVRAGSLAIMAVHAACRDAVAWQKPRPTAGTSAQQGVMAASPAAIVSAAALLPQLVAL